MKKNKRVEGPSFKYKVAIISDKEGEYIQNLIEAFSKVEIFSEFIHLQDLGLMVEEGNTKIFNKEVEFLDYDGVLLNASENLFLFIEPLLNELTDKGVYCNIKPAAFNILSNSPYLLTSLNLKGIQLKKIKLISDIDILKEVIKDFKFPLLLESYSETIKSQKIFIESEKTLNSLIKNLEIDFKILVVQEFFEEDIDQSIIIDEDIYTVRKKWVEDKMANSKNGLSINLDSRTKDILIKTSDIIGCDIIQIKTIGEKVISVKPVIDFEEFNQEEGQDIYSVIARMYKNKFEKSN